MHYTPNSPAILAVQEARQDLESLENLLANGSYDALDQALDALSERYLGGDVYSRPDYEYVCNEAMLFKREQSTLDRIHTAQRWVAAKPTSYHARLTLGAAWIAAAAQARGSGWASSVSEAQWLTARLFRDCGCAELLHATSLNAKPTMAYTAMMQVTSYLAEPDWMVALFRGDLPMPYEVPSDPDEKATWDAAMTRYKEYANDLPLIPRSLPSQLPARKEHEMDEGRNYWLMRALDVCPKNMFAHRLAVYYLYPRWFGDHEAMAAYINGPLCKPLAEEDRGILWRVKEEDELDSYPDSDDIESVNEHKARWTKLIARPAAPYSAVRARVAAGAFYSRFGPLEESARLLDEAAKMANDLAVAETFGRDDLRNFVIDFLEKPELDKNGAFRFFCEQRLVEGNDEWAAMVIAIGHRLGTAGFELNPERSKQLLAQACEWMVKDDQHSWVVHRLISNLWEYGKQTQLAYDLANEIANLTNQMGKLNAPIALFLNDVYINALTPKSPDSLVNKQLAETVLKLASDTGHARSMFYYARHLIDSTYIDCKPAVYPGAKELFYKSMQAGEGDSRLALFKLMIGSGGNDDQKWAHDTLVPELLERLSDDDDRADFYSNLVWVYNAGRGAPSLIPLATAWAKACLEIKPDDEYSKSVLKDANGLSVVSLFDRLAGNKSKDKVRQALQEGKAYAPYDFEI